MILDIENWVVYDGVKNTRTECFVKKILLVKFFFFYLFLFIQGSTVINKIKRRKLEFVQLKTVIND